MRLHIEIDGALRIDVPPIQVNVDHTIHVPPPPREGTCFVTADFGSITSKSEGFHMAYVLPDGLEVGLVISYVDAEGNAAVVDGAIHWESSNPDIVDVFVDSDADTGHATLQALKIGTCQVVARADADLGSGVRELITTLDVEVVAGEAVAGTISPSGEPHAPAQPK